MDFTFKLKISIITLLYHSISSSAYEFQSDNMTFLKSIIKEAMRADAHRKVHLNNIPHTHVVKTEKPPFLEPKHARTVFNKHNIDEELNKEEEVLTEALRMGQTAIANKRKKKEKIRKDYMAMLNAQRAIAANERRIREVQAFMKFSYRATSYLYDEVVRIKRERVVLDMPRKIVAEVESSLNSTYLHAIEECVANSMEKHAYEAWEDEPNKITLHVISDPSNDGLH